MKKIIFFSIVLAVFSVSKAFSGPDQLILISSNTYNNDAYDGHDNAFAVTVDNDGNVIVTGKSDADVEGCYDVATVKFDKSLETVLNVARYNGPDSKDDVGLAVATGLDGSIYVAGYSDYIRPSGKTSRNWLVLKYASDLSGPPVVATYKHYGELPDKACGVAVDENGNVFVAGTIEDDNPDFFVIKYTKDLAVISSATFNSGGYDHAYGVALDSSGNVFIVGTFFAGGLNYNDYMVVKFNNDLVFVSSATYNGGNNDIPSGIAVHNDEVVISGRRRDPSTAIYEFYTIKYDNSLTTVLDSYVGTQTDDTFGVSVDGYGNITVLGYRDANPDYFYTVKYNWGLDDTLGEHLLNPGPNGQPGGIAVDKYGNIFVAGKFWNDAASCEYDYVVAKYFGRFIADSVTPSSVEQNTSSDITITGNFLDNSLVSFNSGSGIEIETVNQIDANRIDVHINVLRGAKPGPKDIEVRMQNSSSTLSGAFTVTESPNTPFDNELIKLAETRFSVDDVSCSAAGVAIDAQGNIFVIGNIYDGENDFLTLKYDANLILKSSVTAEGTNIGDKNVAHDIAVDSDGDIFVAGETDAPGGENSLIIKYDNDLKTVSARKISGFNGKCRAYGIAFDKTPGENLIITGERISNSPGAHYECFIELRDKSDLSLSGGQPPVYHSEGFRHARARDVVVDSDNNIFITGYTRSPVALSDVYITLKYPGGITGTPIKTYYNGNNGNDRANGITVAPDGGVIVTGRSSNGNDDDFCTIKYSNELTDPVVDRLNGPGYDKDQAYSVAVDGDGNAFVTGVTFSESGYGDILTVKYDKYMNIAASAVYDIDNRRDLARDVAIDKDGNVIVVGRSEKAPGTKTFDIVVIKYLGRATNPTITSLSVTEFEPGKTYDVVITGTDLFPGLSVKSGSPAGDIIINSVVLNDSIQVTVNLTVKTDATPGSYYIKVTNVDGGSFTLSPAYRVIGLVISAATPSSGNQGDTLDVVLTGELFDSASTVAFSNEGIAVNSVEFVSSNELKTNITIADECPPGEYDITVTNSLGGSFDAAEIFEVILVPEIDIFADDDDDGIDAGVGGVKVQGGAEGYANPANGEQIKLHYRASAAGSVVLRVFTLRGQLVRELAEQTTGAEDDITWDCRNADGSTVSSGLYICYIKGPGLNKTSKVAVLR